MEGDAMGTPTLLVRAIPGSGGELEGCLPPTRLLQRFDLHTSSFKAVGYLARHAGAETPDDLVRLSLRSQVGSPNAHIGEFFVVVRETSTGVVRVLTDATGSFPVYASWDGKCWWISTSLREVALRLPRPKLNAPNIVRWLTGERRGGTSTIIHDVLSAPAGATLVLGVNESWHIAPPLAPPPASEPEAILTRHITEAADAVAAALEQAVKDCTAGEATSCVASDLTSGLDSSLVAWCAKQCGRDVQAFSMVEGSDDPDCRIPVIRAFAERHALTHQIIDVTDKAPFSTDDDIRWGVDSPETVAWSRIAQYLQAIAKQGHVLRLTGEGGDEVLIQDSSLTAGPDSSGAFAQRHQDRMTQGMGTLLSPVGIKLAAAAGSEHEYSPSRIPQAVIQSRRALFPLAWHYGVWPLAPFLDQRVLKAARSIPLALTGKHEIWQHRLDIFLPEQLEPKMGQVGSTAMFAVRRFDLTCDLLKKSVLERAGIIEAEGILARLADNDTSHWLSSIAGTWLWRIVALEIFLQSLGDVNVEKVQ